MFVNESLLQNESLLSPKNESVTAASNASSNGTSGGRTMRDSQRWESPPGFSGDEYTLVYEYRYKIIRLGTSTSAQGKSRRKGLARSARARVVPKGYGTGLELKKSS